jgi:hypothetical protein
MWSKHDRLRSHAKLQRQKRAGSRSEKWKGVVVWPWPIDFKCCCATVLECTTYLLYWDVPRAFLWKFRFLTVVATMRTADLWGLAWAKYQGTGGKAQRSDTLETLECCVTALSFFQEVYYFSFRAKPHTTTVRTPIVVRSLRDVFTC